MNGWEAVLLGLLQGLTEFIPVSSSGHLVITQHLLGLSEHVLQNVTFDVFVHFGTVLSIITVYRRMLGTLVRDTWKGLRHPQQWPVAWRQNQGFRTALLLAVASIPAALAYATLKHELEKAFNTPRLAAGMLIVTGLLLLLTRLRPNPTGDWTFRKAVVAGIAQAFAMIPGISRSGATICTAIYQDVDREKATNFSFLMLLPVVLGGTLLKITELWQSSEAIPFMNLFLGTFVAYISGIWAIRFVLEVVRRGRLEYFAYYCFLIGILGVLLL